MEKKKILVVDDEPEICSLLSDYFVGKGFSVAVAHNGREALDKVKETKPDLITLDIIMPVMNGLDFLKEIKSEPSYSDIPVIMLTVRTKPADVEEAIFLNADFYLPKPFSLGNLMNFINLIFLESK